MKYIVYQYNRSYADVFKHKIAEFDDEFYAFDFIDNEYEHGSGFYDIWYGVEEE